MDILKNLRKFLINNLDFKKPVLLAYSGGSDSSCLFDLLLKLKKELSIDLHVAHVDHGWRKKSAGEAEKIKKSLKELHIPYHIKRLKLDKNQNLENESREKRYQFFASIYKKFNFDAIILAHHKDDLAETVLKRCLEGSSLYSLTSMREISFFNNMRIFRPLLATSKKDILKYLKDNNIQYFLDATNENTKYLRAKMRKDIFPYLKKNFNKDFINSLAAISSSSLELDLYLQKKLSPYLQKILKKSFGLCLDLNELTEAIELKYILKKAAQDQKIDLSRKILDQSCFWIINKRPNLRLKLKNADVFADRGYFFILKKNLNLTIETSELKFGKSNIGPWEVLVERICTNKHKNSSFVDLFQDKLTLYLPDNKYFIGMLYCSKLKKIWENAKVPSFLRRMVPIIYDMNNIPYDFLSGRKICIKNSNIFKISLKLKYVFEKTNAFDIG